MDYFISSNGINGTFDIKQDLGMLRWETKRGCPYKCSFCAHRNLENGRVHYMKDEKAFSELAFFKDKGVKRINVLNPIFNIGQSYLPIMNEIDRLNFSNTQFTFQSKIELLEKKDGPDFLNLVEKNNSQLEFGLQTIIPVEYSVIDRANNIEKIKQQLEILNDTKIFYGVGLIYGLPNQTVDSFKANIEFAENKGCKKITVWPLMLLTGTPLFLEKNKWNLKEEIIEAIKLVGEKNTNKEEKTLMKKAF